MLLLPAAAAAVVATLGAIATAAHDESGAGATNMLLLPFSDYPEAVCMDGSPSGIYLSPATTQPDQFVLYLQGGGWCYDETSCTQRCGTRNGSSCSGGLASSTVWGPNVTLAGLFNSLPSMSPLSGATKAYLRYCVSRAPTHMVHMDPCALWAACWRPSPAASR